MSSESIIKYFIIQRIASTIFLLRTISILIGVNIEVMENLIKLSIIIKLGLAPFHNWVLIIIEFISYYSIFIILTIIKIQPITIVFQLNSNKIITLVILIRIIIRSISALNQSSIRKTLGWSSIYNIGIIITSTNKLIISLTYLIVYSLIIIILVKQLISIKINYLNQIVFNEFSILIKINMWLNILSIRGFPPTIGFFIKLIIVQNIINENQNIIIIVIVLTSILVTIFYTRIAFNSIIIYHHIKKWITISINKPIYYLIILNLILISTILTIINFI